MSCFYGDNAWDLHFCRPPHNRELEELSSLIEVLGSSFSLMEDARVWTGKSSGSFSCKYLVYLNRPAKFPGFSSSKFYLKGKRTS